MRLLFGRCWLQLVAYAALYANHAYGSAQDAEKQARQEKDPRKAIAILQSAEAETPEKWQLPYQAAQLYKHKLKDCAAALPLYERALEKSAHSEPRVLVEAGFCWLKQKDYVTAQKYVDLYLATGKKFETAKIREFAARLYVYLRSPDKVREYAPEGSSLHNQYSPKTISFRWPIKLAATLRKLRKDRETVVRITLPVETPYQRLVSWSIVPSRPDPGFVVGAAPVHADGNSYAELHSERGAWPEEIILTAEVAQTMVQLLPQGRLVPPVVSNHASPIYAAANDDLNGRLALENAEFRQLATGIAGTGTAGEKATRLLNELAKKFRYAPARVKKNADALATWHDGQGDCVVYSRMAMALLRSQSIPVRRLYGFSFRSSGAPHAIVEVYDEQLQNWVPTEPQTTKYLGIINPSFVVFSRTVGVSVVERKSDVIHIDTPLFWWGPAGQKMPVEFKVSVGGKVIHASKQAYDLEEAEASDKNPGITSMPDQD